MIDRAYICLSVSKSWVRGIPGDIQFFFMFHGVLLNRKGMFLFLIKFYIIWSITSSRWHSRLETMFYSNNVNPKS